MINIRRKKNVDIRQCPQAVSIPAKHVSLGDLHGNALKLIFSLIKEGVIEITKKHYQKIVTLYEKDTDKITQKDIQNYQAILQTITINKEIAVTLIGDEFADRGKNDYFTLLVLKRLKEGDVDLDITISNHSAEFICDYDKPKFTGAHALFPGQGDSLTRMMQLITKGVISEAEIRDIVKDVYIPTIKAIGYTVADNGNLSIFSHAPIGLETIESLARKFKIEYKEKTREDLIATIDAINDRVRIEFSSKQLTKLIQKEQHSSTNPEGFKPATEGSMPITHNSPLNRIIWNRLIERNLKTQPENNAFIVKFVHGHVGDSTTAPHKDLLNLDNQLGKLYNYIGEYVSRHSDEKTALQYHQEKKLSDKAQEESDKKDNLSKLILLKTSKTNIAAEIQKCRPLPLCRIYDETSPNLHRQEKTKKEIGAQQKLSAMLMSVENTSIQSSPLKSSTLRQQCLSPNSVGAIQGFPEKSIALTPINTEIKVNKLKASPLKSLKKLEDINKSSDNSDVERKSYVISNEEMVSEFDSNKKDDSEQPEWFQLLFSSINHPKMLAASIIIGISILVLTSGIALAATGALLVTAGTVGLGFRFFSSAETSDMPKAESSVYQTPQAVLQNH